MSPRSRSPELNEQSPLLSESSSADSHDGERRGHRLADSLELEASMAEMKSSWYLLLLTLSIGGLQIVWSVELSNGSPYLLSLGMSKSLLAFVWIASPLSGVLVQPYVGIRSDNCRISWGKRKPFMIGGAAGTVAALLTLAWTREIVRGILGLFGVASDAPAVQVSVIVVATLFMCILDIAINTVQAGIRAFIVDGAPSHQQEDANAWASRITGVGNVLGYIFGYIDLPKHFPFFGDTQFKVLCVIAGFALSSTLCVSCLLIKERDPRLDGPPAADNPGIIAFFKQVFTAARRLPPGIRKVCEIQFAHWIGWFPFLYYITTYIGQLYINPFLKPDLSESELEKLWEQATRIGTFALLIYAIVSFLANTFLPFFVVPTFKPTATSIAVHETTVQPIMPTSPIGTRARSSSRSSASFSNAGATNLSVYLPPESYEHIAVPTLSQPSTLSRLLTRLQIPNLTLRRCWLASQLLFAVCMFSTFFMHTPLAATIMAAVVGVSWSVTLWAPFALISAEIALRDERNRRRLRRIYASRSQETSPTEAVDDGEAYKPPTINDAGEEEESTDQAGIVLGLHNAAISAPQIFATLISSAVFKAFQKPRGVPGDESVGMVLRLGGVAALVAAWLTSQLGDGSDET